MKTSKKSTKKAAVASKVSDELTRKEAAAILKISIYAVDQLLLKKKLKSLKTAVVQSYKKSSK